ncbi:MAG: NADH-quinone oxidoreductase subunit N [Candidatus Firestonebacteria bacterium]|nr:NADH-quinone oxidoreductase subunit N [Candidatus Firestonebacteria bacterium]
MTKGFIPEAIMQGLLALTPEVFVLCLAFFIIIADLILPVKSKRNILDIAAVGLTGALLLTIGALFQQGMYIFNNALVVDSFARFFKIIILVSAVFMLLMSRDYKALENNKIGEYTALVVLVTLGMMLMAGASDLLMLFLSIEFVSIVFFVLVGFVKKDSKSREAAVKYFLIGAFSSAVFVYGASFLVGVTGASSFPSIQQYLIAHGISNLFIVGLLLMLVGFGFKIALVPFHMWAPDAYEGAPAPVTAFLSVASKSAGVAVLIRTFLAILPDNSNVNLILALLAAITMTVGNLVALTQNNAKRLLAYSGIAHVGFIMMGFVAYGLFGVQSVLIYTLAYLFTNMGAFAFVIAIYNKTGSDDIRDYGGLSLVSPALAFVFFVFLISLAGVPPTAGFLGKLLVLGAAIDSGYTWLAVIGVLNSVVSLYFYARIAYFMYFAKEKKITEAIKPSLSLNIIIYSSLFMVLYICLLPEQFLNLAKKTVQLLTGSFHGY